MKMNQIAAIVAASVVLAGCGERVEVPPAHVGKVMTKDGYQEGLIPTSKLRLPACFTYCDRMVLLDVSDKSYVEPMTIFIPADKLNITLDVRATLSVNQKKANELFNSLPQQAQTDQLSIISNDSIYNTYAKQILQAEVRAYLTQYSIAEIASNNEKINADLQILMAKVLGERTPFNVRYVGLTNLKFPEIITTAQENAAQRREAIQGEEAQLQISKVKLERELQEAKMQRAIEKEKAETEAVAQQTLAQSVDPRVLRLRELEIEKIKAEKWNGQLPATIMGTEVPMIMSITK